MGELEAELTEEEYRDRLDRLARRTKEMMESEGSDYTDAIQVHTSILGAFYEEHPVTIIEYAHTDPTDREVIGLLEGRPVMEPVERIKEHAYAILAHEVVSYIEKELE